MYNLCVAGFGVRSEYRCVVRENGSAARSTGEWDEGESEASSREALLRVRMQKRSKKSGKVSSG